MIQPEELVGEEWAVAASGTLPELEKALREEETALRQQDKLHWLPLRRELKKLRHARLK